MEFNAKNYDELEKQLVDFINGKDIDDANPVLINIDKKTPDTPIA